MFRALVSAAMLLSTGMSSSAAAWPEIIEISRCVIAVEGVTYLDEPCRFSFLDNGDPSFVVFGPESDTSNGYFAYVFVEGDTASAYWNGSVGESYAHVTLDLNLSRDGACWSGNRGKVCAYR